MFATADMHTAILFAGLEDAYITYLEDTAGNGTPPEQDAAKISAALDEKVEAHTVTDDDLADFEWATRRAGFYAGYAAAMANIAAAIQNAAA